MSTAGHRKPSIQATWDSTRGARNALGDRAAATQWLRHPIAGGLRAATEVEHATRWRTATGDPIEGHTPALLAAWFAFAYDFTVNAPADPAALAAAAEMPMTAQWLTDRADRVDTAATLVASPAAVAVALAAAQALTTGDVETLAAQLPQLPYPNAHLTLSAPLLATPSTLEETEGITALTWWPTSTGMRIADWIGTGNAVTGDEGGQLRAAAKKFGASLPNHLLNGERHLEAASAQPAEDDQVYSEGQFTFDGVIADPDRDLLPRLVLALRGLIATQTLTVEEELVRPPSSTGHVKRVPVTVVRARDDFAHTRALLGPGTTTTIRRRRNSGKLHWTDAQWETST